MQTFCVCRPIPCAAVHGSLANVVLIGETDFKVSTAGASDIWEFRGMKEAEIDVRPEEDSGEQDVPGKIEPYDIEQPAYQFALYQNHPNPFNPATMITYEIKESVHVCLQIFDVKGRLIRTLVNSERNTGKHDAIWDGLNEIGRPAVSGIYFYRLVAGDYVQTKKMVLLR